MGTFVTFERFIGPKNCNNEEREEKEKDIEISGLLLFCGFGVNIVKLLTLSCKLMYFFFEWNCETVFQMWAVVAVVSMPVFYSYDTSSNPADFYFLHGPLINYFKFINTF